MSMKETNLTKGLDFRAVPSALKVLQGRGWARRLYIYPDNGGGSFTVSEELSEQAWVSGEYVVEWELLLTGIDHAHHLARPFYRKLLDFIKGDVRTIVIAALTAAVIAIVTELIVRAFD